MPGSRFRSFSGAIVLSIALQVILIPLPSGYAEDTKTKIDRIISYIDKSNRLVNSWNANLEASDLIMADTDDAIDSNTFDSVQALAARAAEVRRKFAIDNEAGRVLSAAQNSECSKIDANNSGSDLYPSVEDVCLEFLDSNFEFTSIREMAEKDHTIVETRIAELSKAAADAKAVADAAALADAKAAADARAAADAKKPAPKASIKPTIKKAAPKKVTCKKGSLVRVFDGIKCPPGYIKK